MALVVKNQLGNVLTFKQDVSYVNAAQIKHELLTFLDTCSLECLWLDMGQVKFIDSIGIGIIATVYSTAKQQNRRIVLCRINPPVQLVLELTGLDQVLEFSDTVPDFSGTGFDNLNAQEGTFSLSAKAG